MKILIHKDFGNSFKDLSYWLSSKWSSFTYLFRKPYYKFRLFKKLASIEYYGPWEMSEYLQEVSFTVFTEFYENGGIEHINWNSDEYHEHAKREMNDLYKWWTKDRHERKEEIETVLETWSEHHISWWEECEDENCFQYQDQETRYTEYLFKLLKELEEKFEKEKEENFIRLVKIKGYLWT